jgi:multiple sugar transport system permease protein
MLLDEVYEESQFAVVDLRVPAILGLGAVVLTIVILMVRCRGLGLGALARHEAKWAYLFMLPWLLGFLIFTLGPMLASLFFSFTQYNVLGAARWVGLKNFGDVFGADWPNVAKSFANVLYIAGVGVPLGLVTGLAIALLLNTGVRGMRYYRTAFYLPAIVPALASVVLWLWILTPDPSKGIFNNLWSQTILPWFGVQPPGWTTSEAWAKPTLIMMGLWGAGSGMILWLAGLKGIPTTLYEAAEIDGASPWQQFWTVTLPQLSPIVFFNTVMGFIAAIQTFDSVYVITKGLNTGPADSLLMPVYHLFTNAFNYFRMGYASALAWVIFGIILLLTLVQFKLAPKWVHYEVDN